MSHPQLYHVTRNEQDIREGGFHGKSRGTGKGSGSYFGSGTYFHTNKAHSDEYLTGTRAYGYGDETQIQASAHLDKPFVVNIKPSEQKALPGDVMHRALRDAGLIKPGEKLSPEQVTARLKSAGYDGVHVRQSKYSHEIAGDQLVVFDSSKAKFGHHEGVPSGRTNAVKSSMTANETPKPAKALNVKSDGVVVGQIRLAVDGKWHATAAGGTDLGAFESQQAAGRAIMRHRKVTTIKAGAKEEARAHRSRTRIAEPKSTEKLTGSAARIEAAVRAGKVTRR